MTWDKVGVTYVSFTSRLIKRGKKNDPETILSITLTRQLLVCKKLDHLIPQKQLKIIIMTVSDASLKWEKNCHWNSNYTTKQMLDAKLITQMIPCL